jgi:hypothetical protein
MAVSGMLRLLKGAGKESGPFREKNQKKVAIEPVCNYYNKYQE